MINKASPFPRIKDRSQTVFTNITERPGLRHNACRHVPVYVDAEVSISAFSAQLIHIRRCTLRPTSKPTGCIIPDFSHTKTT